MARTTGFDEITLRRGLATASIADDAVTPQKVAGSLNDMQESAAVTATADGLTTGLVPLGTDVAVITSANADHIATLPDAPIGHLVVLIVAATGYELRSHAPATVGINGGTGAGAESAIAANTVVWAQRTTATNWIAWSRVAAGTLSVVQVAAA